MRRAPVRDWSRRWRKSRSAWRVAPTDLGEVPMKPNRRFQRGDAGAAGAGHDIQPRRV